MPRQSSASNALVGVALGSLLLTACGGEDPEGSGTETVNGEQAEVPDPPENPEETDDADPEHVELPDTPAGEASAELLKILNAEEDSTAADWDGWLGEEVLAEYLPAEFAQVINTGVRPAQPFTATEYSGDTFTAVVRLESTAAAVDMQLSLNEDHEIQLLLFTEPGEDYEPAETLSEVEDAWTEGPEEVRALVAETHGGDTRTLIEIGAEEPAPLGSAFKLYVLLAVTEAIEEGETDWDQTLEVTDELRSLPTGTLHNEETGHQVSVREAAQAMIEISDNTATDMIIDHIGRQTVEDAVVLAGHHDPELLQPFLTTRELFQLRWGHPELGEDWDDIDAGQRRDILDEIAELPLEIEAADVTDDDAAQRGLEWYASAQDMADLHSALNEKLRDPGHSPLPDILGANPGLAHPLDSEPWWHLVTYKGGSSPGVITGTWSAHGEDGTVRTVVLLATDDDAESLRSREPHLFGLSQDALVLQE